MKRTAWIVLTLFVMNVIHFTFPMTSGASVRQVMSGQEMENVVGGHGQVETSVIFPHASNDLNNWEAVGTPVKYVVDVNNLSMNVATYTITVTGMSGSPIFYETSGTVPSYTSELLTGQVDGLSANYHTLTVSVQNGSTSMISQESVQFRVGQ